MAFNVYTDEQGRRLPSVTGTTGKNLGWSKDALMGWAVKQTRIGKDPNVVKRESAQVGNAVHKIVRMLLENEEQINSYDPETVWRVMRAAIMTFLSEVADWNHKLVFNACMSWAAWYCTHPITVISIEKPLISNSLMFGGTPDLVCRDPFGNLIIIDWKTGAYIYPEHAIQLAAYSVIWREKTGENVDFLMDVRLDTAEPLWENHLLEDDSRSAAEHVFANLLEVEAMRSTVENGMNMISSGRPG